MAALCLPEEAALHQALSGQRLGAEPQAGTIFTCPFVEEQP